MTAIRMEEKSLKQEPFWSTMLQVFPTFVIAGLGMVAAGLVLNHVQEWKVFREVSEILIMVPALLGLKGNLEMTLASRLSTAANMGNLDSSKDALSLIVGNLLLVQSQGIVVGFLASLAGIAMGWIPIGKMNLDHGLLLCASAMVTASLASFILGVIMVAVILLARMLKVNPDNVATPIAASLGDVTTLSLLAWIADLLHKDMEAQRLTAPILIGAYFLLLPLILYAAWCNECTRDVLLTGWTPVLMAMLISSGGGLILDHAVGLFKGITIFQPVMNGAGGNLVAIQASRMTTYLHAVTNSLPGNFPQDDDRICVLPCTAFCDGSWREEGSSSPRTSSPHARTARVLLSLLLPGHLIFVYATCLIESTVLPSAFFLTTYLAAATAQVVLLLYMCQILIYWMWSRGTDPDNAAIPYLTAVGDLLGTAFLTIAFLLLQAGGDPTMEGLQHERDQLTNATIPDNILSVVNSTMTPTFF